MRELAEPLRRYAMREQRRVKFGEVHVCFRYKPGPHGAMRVPELFCTPRDAIVLGVLPDTMVEETQHTDRGNRFVLNVAVPAEEARMIRDATQWLIVAMAMFVQLKDMEAHGLTEPRLTGFHMLKRNPGSYDLTVTERRATNLCVALL